MFILDSWITQFAQHSDKFRYDTDKNVVLNPGNLPNVSLDQVSADVTTLQTHLQSTGTQADSQLGRFNWNNCLNIKAFYKAFYFGY